MDNGYGSYGYEGRFKGVLIMERGCAGDNYSGQNEIVRENSDNDSER